MNSLILAHGEACRPPAQIDGLIERVMAGDRRYFEDRPQDTDYLRPYVPGELWPLVPPADRPLVIQVVRLGPGLRARIPIFIESVRFIADDSDRRLPL